jgi:hypothetical protein
MRALKVFRDMASDLDDVAVPVDLNNSQHQQSTSTSNEFTRKAYLEARAGAKALLTGKIAGSGGTITQRVYTLSSLRCADCLQDLQYYATTQSSSTSTVTASTKQIPNIVRDFTEALAELVEFDGLDSLTDPSPSSALTLAQYTPKKAIFVRRCLLEKVLPLGTQILGYYNAQAIDTATRYMQQFYPDQV